MLFRKTRLSHTFGSSDEIQSSHLELHVLALLCCDTMGTHYGLLVAHLNKRPCIAIWRTKLLWSRDSRRSASMCRLRNQYLLQSQRRHLASDHIIASAEKPRTSLAVQSTGTSSSRGFVDGDEPFPHKNRSNDEQSQRRHLASRVASEEKRRRSLAVQSTGTSSSRG